MIDHRELPSSTFSRKLVGLRSFFQTHGTDNFQSNGHMAIILTGSVLRLRSGQFLLYTCPRGEEFTIGNLR